MRTGICEGNMLTSPSLFLDVSAQTVQESHTLKPCSFFAQIFSEDELAGFSGLSVFQRPTTFLTLSVEF